MIEDPATTLLSGDSKGTGVSADGDGDGDIGWGGDLLSASSAKAGCDASGTGFVVAVVLR